MNKKIISKMETYLKLSPVDYKKSSSEKQKIKCLLCGAFFQATPKSKIMNFKKFGSVGCPQCSNKTFIEINKKKAIAKLDHKGYKILSKYHTMKDKIKVSYIGCEYNHRWEDIPNNLIYREGFCKICKHSSARISESITGISNKESNRMLNNFMNHFNGYDIEANFKVSSYTCTFRYEEKCVFFVQMNRYRQGIIKDKKYFLRMKNAFNDAGYKLYIIYETEFRDNEDIIISKIIYLINQSKLSSIYARKCLIKMISPKEKNDLLNKNHIQGESASGINVGAFFENKLIAVMTFVKPRVLLGFKNKDFSDIYELARYVSDNNYRTPGIASKLLAYFKNNYIWKEIFSYADLRWSAGDIYYKLGFKLDSTVTPNYHYIIDGKIKHRWGYRKDRLKELFPEQYNPSLTEYQNMTNFNYDRVWDCGNLKFIMKNEILT